MCVCRILESGETRRREKVPWKERHVFTYPTSMAPFIGASTHVNTRTGIREAQHTYPHEKKGPCLGVAVLPQGALHALEFIPLHRLGLALHERPACVWMCVCEMYVCMYVWAFVIIGGRRRRGWYVTRTCLTHTYTHTIHAPLPGPQHGVDLREVALEGLGHLVHGLHLILLGC